jgi:hypothetical protein
VPENLKIIAIFILRITKVELAWKSIKIYLIKEQE